MGFGKFAGGLVLITCAVLLVPLFMFSAPYLMLNLFVFPNIVWLLIFIGLASAFAITGIYFAITGLAGGIRGEPSKHELHIPEKVENVVQEAEQELEKVVKIIICPGCNHENSENANFCAGCGNKLRG